MTTRWAPPIPTIGRAGPRIEVLPGSTLLQRLEEYYFQFRSVPDIFERRVPPSFQKVALRRRGEPAYLSDFSPAEQQSLLLRNLYFKVSAASRSKMRRELDRNQLHHVRSWFHTCNASVLPLMICSERDPPHYEVDQLCNWALENCAHNYSLFQREFKALKKAIRKGFALHGHINRVEVRNTMLPYYLAMVRHYPRGDAPTNGRYVLLWTQTRATGMADSVMIRQSIEKFKSTVTDPGVNVTLQPEALRDVVLPAIGADGKLAKVSVGTTACLESTRAQGGKTSYLSRLARCKSVTREYDFKTLEFTECEPRPVRSATDLLNWAVCDIHKRPVYTSSIRVHAVAEPGKARTITVAPFSYQVLMGVFAHVFQPTLRSKHVRSGLKADRHLWRFLRETLNPQNVAWQDLDQGSQVFALSTDLSQATDWGVRMVARQIWRALIECADSPEFPLGLAVLAMTKYTGRRFCFLPDGFNNYELAITQRGWFMGDMMTKVILTLAHQYCCRLTGLTVYTLVGDDEIALSNSRRLLRKHVEETLPKIFSVSGEDTYVSSFFAFYCEEGTVLPQKASQSLHVQMRRGEQLYYLDYPRIRLLLPQIIETDAYSMTNIGRFALLGKEARWVDSVNRQARAEFSRASVIQHLLVPMDKDTLCPYTPIEIGGDGAMPHTAEFMRRVVDDKCHNPRETKWRLSSLLNQKFGYRFVRSARTDKVVNKHHLYLPKIESMKALLPPESVVVPEDANCRLLLRSMRFDNLADPQSVFFKIAKGLYYKALMEGRTPPEPVFNIDRQFTGGHTHDPTVDFAMFIETWRNPGFKFQDQYDYWVILDRIAKLDVMSLGWDFDKTRYPSAREMLNLWVRQNVDFKETTFDDILAMIKDRQPLPRRVADRLNLCIESDSYILHVLDVQKEKLRDTLTIVTRDQRLCGIVRRHLNNKWPQIRHRVICLDPVIYLTGRVEEVEALLPSMVGSTVITDPGAMLHVDYSEFTDGFPNREDVWDAKVYTRVSYHSEDIVVAEV